MALRSNTRQRVRDELLCQLVKQTRYAADRDKERERERSDELSPPPAGSNSIKPWLVVAAVPAREPAHHGDALRRAVLPDDRPAAHGADRDSQGVRVQRTTAASCAALHALLQIEIEVLFIFHFEIEFKCAVTNRAQRRAWRF